MCSLSSSVYDNVLCLEELQGRTLEAHKKVNISSHQRDGAPEPNLSQGLRPLVAEGHADQAPQLVQDALQSLPRNPGLQQEQYPQQEQDLYPVFQSQNTTPPKPFKIHPYSPLHQHSSQQSPVQHDAYYQLQPQHTFQTLPQEQYIQAGQPEPCQPSHQPAGQHDVESSIQQLTFPSSSHQQSCFNLPLLIETPQQQPLQEDDINNQDNLGERQTPLQAASLNTSYTVINPDTLSHTSHMSLLDAGERPQLFDTHD